MIIRFPFHLPWKEIGICYRKIITTAINSLYFLQPYRKLRVPDKNRNNYIREKNIAQKEMMVRIWISQTNEMINPLDQVK